MNGTRTERAAAAEYKYDLFLLIASPQLAEHRPSLAPVDIFTSEAAAREAFRRIRLEAGSCSGWAQLVAVDDDVVRPLCWFGRPAEPLLAPTRRTRQRRRRWALGALGVSVGVIVSASLGMVDRAGAAVAPQLSRTEPVTVTGSQRVEPTALNTSDACHRTEISLIDGDRHTVAFDAGRAGEQR